MPGGRNADAGRARQRTGERRRRQGLARGRTARCRPGGAPARSCVFFPHNGDGSFAIDVGGRGYYADKVGVDAIVVDYDNGAHMVPQGRYVRDRADPACWVAGEGGGGRICVETAR